MKTNKKEEQEAIENLKNQIEILKKENFEFFLKLRPLVTHTTPDYPYSDYHPKGSTELITSILELAEEVKYMAKGINHLKGDVHLPTDTPLDNPA